MNQETNLESAIPQLILLVTGTAPRSERARTNLKDALQRLEVESPHPMEIDLLEQPQQALEFSVFATPALLKAGPKGEIAVLYGDLSDQEKLAAFLSDVVNA